MDMNRDTSKSSCPRCEEELIISWHVENHKVHNGIGMQTVARDRFVEIDERNCNCEEDEPYTSNEWEQMKDDKI